MPIRDLLAASIVVLAWGMNVVAIRYGLDEMPPLLLGGLRFLLVAFPAILFVRRPNAAWHIIILYGLTICLGQFLFLFFGMALGMPAGLASVVLQSQALFTIVIAAIFLGERLRLHNLLGLAVAGAGLILVEEGAEPGATTMVGFMLTVVAAMSWAAGNIVLKGCGKVDMLGLVVWGALIPPIPFLGLSLAVDGPARIAGSLAEVTYTGMMSVAYMSIAATIVAYSLWGHLLMRHPAGKVAVLSLLIPVVSLLSSAVLLDERLAPVQWYGGTVVMLGLAINLFGGRLLAALPDLRRLLR